jgi:hypothetical protein
MQKVYYGFEVKLSATFYELIPMPATLGCLYPFTGIEK